MTEVWKAIPGFEGLYEASTLGNIRSLDREITYPNGRTYKYRGKVLKAHSVNKYGHQILKLGSQHRKLVHVLVAETFIGPRPDGMEVRHLNGDPTDNRADNLRYGTRSENQRDQYNYGGKHAWGKLDMEQVLQIRDKLAFGHTQKELARLYGVSISRISDIKTGRSFSYLE